MNMECGSRSCRFCMFVSRVNIQKRQLRLPHSMRHYRALLLNLANA
jgi:hypothetical protein